MSPFSTACYIPRNGEFAVLGLMLARLTFNSCYNVSFHSQGHGEMAVPAADAG
jgi:hypothetical protein